MSAPIQLAPGLPPAAADLIADCTSPSAKRPSAALFAERLGPLVPEPDGERTSGKSSSPTARQR